jgi:hypothetical protein
MADTEFFTNGRHPFMYIAPDPKSVATLEQINAVFKAAFDALDALAPSNRERSTGTQYLRTARMWYNAAVVFGQDPVPDLQKRSAND